MTIVSWRDLESRVGMKRADLLNLAAKAPRFYDAFDMVKRSGRGRRHIDNPIGILKQVQRKIYRGVLRDVVLPDNMFGGVARRSARENALAHVGKPTLVKLDVRNHFGRISHRQVFAALRRELGCSPSIAHVLTKLTTVHGRLPHGAPTSSMLANVVMLPAHREICELTRQKGLTYTVFVDDLTISGKGARDVIQPVVAILARHGFAISSHKREILDQRDRQETTGLVVNRRLTVARAKREQLRLDVLDFSRLEAMSARDYASIWGRINHVAYIEPRHGRRLADFAASRLPRVADDEVVVAEGGRIECKDVARHRHRPCQQYRHRTR